MTLRMFVKGKIKNLTLDMSKYDFEYVWQRKSWLYTCRNMTLSMFVKGKVDFRQLTLDMSKYDFEYVC
jgi:hypothetical protein